MENRCPLIRDVRSLSESKLPDDKIAQVLLLSRKTSSFALNWFFKKRWYLINLDETRSLKAQFERSFLASLKWSFSENRSCPSLASKSSREGIFFRSEKNSSCLFSSVQNMKQSAAQVWKTGRKHATIHFFQWVHLPPRGPRGNSRWKWEKSKFGEKERKLNGDWAIRREKIAETWRIVFVLRKRPNKPRHQLTKWRGGNRKEEKAWG